jgi:hypothetical protein
MLELAGVKEMVVSVAGVTVREAVAETLPTAAVTTVVPVATDVVARPLEPVALLIAATVVSDEYQATLFVRVWVELSE